MKLKFKDGTIIEVSDSKGKSKEEIITEAKKVYKDFRDSQKVKDEKSLEQIIKEVSKFQKNKNFDVIDFKKALEENGYEVESIENLSKTWKEHNGEYYKDYDIKLKDKTHIFFKLIADKNYDTIEVIAYKNGVRDSQEKDSFVTYLNLGGLELDSFVGFIYPCKDETWSYKLFNEEDNINLENELNNNPNKKIYSGELCYDKNGNVQYYAIEHRQDVPQEEIDKRGIGEFSNVYKALEGLTKAYRNNSNVKDSKKVKDDRYGSYEVQITKEGFGEGNTNRPVNVETKNFNDLVEAEDYAYSKTMEIYNDLKTNNKDVNIYFHIEIFSTRFVSGYEIKVKDGKVELVKLIRDDFNNYSDEEMNYGADIIRIPFKDSKKVKDSEYYNLIRVYYPDEDRWYVIDENTREEIAGPFESLSESDRAGYDNLPYIPPRTYDSKKVKDESIVLYPNEKKSFEIEYPDLEITYSTVDIHGDWVDYDATIDFTLELSESDVIDALYNIIKPDDDFFSNYASDEDDINIDEIIENNIFPAFDYYYNELKDYFEETARDEAAENIDDYLPSDPREEYNPDED